MSSIRRDVMVCPCSTQPVGKLCKLNSHQFIILVDDFVFLRFSADTMPAKNLVTAGRNATLRIHEATMADDQEEMAGQKAHSTCGQAIDIGRK